MTSRARRIWVSPWLYLVGVLGLGSLLMMVGFFFSDAWFIGLFFLPFVVFSTVFGRSMITTLSEDGIVIREPFWKTTIVLYQDIADVGFGPVASASMWDTDAPIVKRQNGEELALTGQAGYRFRGPNRRVVKFCDALQTRLPDHQS